MCGGVLCSALVAAQPPAVPVETILVVPDQVDIDITAVGDLRADEQVTIRAEIPGRIAQLNFSEGQAVKEKQLLVKLDDAEYVARLEESNAAVKLSEHSFSRTQDLYNKKLSSRQAYDEAVALLEQDRARQSLERVLLAKTRIEAPFSGIIGLRYLSQGAYVRAGDDIVEVVKVDTLKLDFQIPERFLPQIQVGQAVSLQVDAYPATSFPGKVYAINPHLNETTRTASLRARVENPERQLLPGMFARVALTLKQRDQAIVVPEQAIVPQGNQVYVFVVSEGKAKRVPVTLGVRLTGRVEVLSGLSIGDELVVSGQLKLRDGAQVLQLPKPSPQE
ncbi:hypothetical protein TPSD3_15700 [Thioflexithrix psekupsensis]|uniref:Uncharacterized protein n=2 Tax=Thioflexithrix psekupsensis TaxID=1570016 RepID=A0A251X6C4_9GAMM|nr:hypothetical protein TPSD3_15700 [Thioflexithrix psekupsensis]